MERLRAPDTPAPPEKPAQPPRQNRCLVRQRLADASLEQRRQQVVAILSGLGAVVPRLSLVLAQPELDCEPLHDAGFADVKTLAQLRCSETDCPLGSCGILVVCMGADIQPAVQCCSFFDYAADSPPIMAVLVYPDEESLSALGEPEVQKSLTTLMQHGADDVMTVVGKELLTGRRVQEAILRSEIISQKAALMLEHEKAALKKKTARSLEAANDKIIWSLPGNVLESIPLVDETLVECSTQDRVGVGDFSITDQLGAGAFGAVFKAQHPRHGACALKVVPKRCINTVRQLCMLHRELHIMGNLGAHPNVVRAHGALHSKANLILVMEYAGNMNLHAYALKMSKSTGEAVMRKDRVERFCQQEAAAVAHLHASMVCHRDLKPTNFIVTDDGASVRLADFGLSAIAFGPAEKLLHCCGSLPFAAPEVLRLQLDDASRAAGYDGFAADIWSLAMNFVELACGLYSVEQLLDWVPKHPEDVVQRVQDMERFGEAWSRVPETPVAGLCSIVARMVAARPEERWTIFQVVGPEGLGLEELHACPRCGWAHKGGAGRISPVSCREAGRRGGNGEGRREGTTPTGQWSAR